MVNTFAPTSTFRSLRYLDRQRLGKQRSEVVIILNTLQGIPTVPYPDHDGTPKGIYKSIAKAFVRRVELVKQHGATRWRYHPCVQQWAGYTNFLKRYYNAVLTEWTSRGYKNNMPYMTVDEPVIKPWWWGWDAYHASHRSMLWLKDPIHYAKFETSDECPYVWPSKMSVSDIVIALQDKYHLN